MRAFVIGGATLDTIISYENMESMTHRKEEFEQTYLLLREGAKIEVLDQRYFSGGGATNASVSFRRQEFDVTLFCKMGRDLPGEIILKELVSYGINTTAIRFSDMEGTASSFVVPSLSGDRTLFAYRGANTTLLSEELPIGSMKGADFVYITSLSRASAVHLPELVQAAGALNIPVAVNPGISQLKLGSGFLKEALSGIEILITNYEEAQQFMASLMQIDPFYGSPSSGVLMQEVFSLKAYFEKILSLGPRVVVVTNGREGVYVATHEQIYFHPAKEISVVNTLGAGDAFGSSFVGCYYAGDGIEEAIRAGIVNSASVIAYPDAKSGLLSRENLKKEIKALGVDSLTRSDLSFPPENAGSL
jgi:sugar/nucleoside kinase (ribokinase family)